MVLTIRSATQSAIPCVYEPQGEIRKLEKQHQKNSSAVGEDVRRAAEACAASSGSSGAGAVLQLSESIWLRTNSNKITEFTALMRGVEDPYEGGFYVFDITIPNEYPHFPPKVKFLTFLQTSINCNPNLYGDIGKVCLSILGNYHGPSWAPFMTIESVCRQIQVLLVPEPLENEPGWERKGGKHGKGKAKDPMYDWFKQAARHANLRIAVARMLTKPPTASCRSFLPLMRALFAEKAAEMIAFARLHARKSPKPRNIHVSAGPANFTERIDYAKRAEELEKLAMELGAEGTCQGAGTSAQQGLAQGVKRAREEGVIDLTDDAIDEKPAGKPKIEVVLD